MKTVTVISHKYNDILFSTETDEFKSADIKQVIIFKLLSDSLDNYPRLDYFDRVFVFDYERGKNNIYSIKLLFFLLKIRAYLKSNFLFISNPYLLFNKLITLFDKHANVILLEDGLLNYVKQNQSIPFQKFVIEKLIGFNSNTILDKVTTTYLSCPERAVLFAGNKMKISLNPAVNGKVDSEMDFMISEISGKKVFIGQNLYPKYLSENSYYHKVQEIIDKFKIDYYVPHAYEGYRNQLANVDIFRLKKYTFEYLALYADFELFSFGSTVLFSAKMINNKLRSNLIYNECIRDFYSSILIDACDSYIKD